MEPNITEFCNNETTMSVTMCFNDGHRIAIVAYSVFMVVSAIANTTVLINILKNRRVRRCSNNLMFMHLAIADLLVTFVMMPMEIGWNITVMWTAGDLACRILSFFRIFGLFLSSFVVVCISLDRCFAISSPMASTVNAAQRAKMMMIVSWTLATICSSPQAVLFHVEAHPEVPSYVQCVAFNMFPSEIHELTYNLFGMFIMYGLPLVVISISYICIMVEICRRYKLSPDGNFRRSSIHFLDRAKTRTLKMAITVFVVFLVCWTPYHVMCLWYWIDRASALEVDQRIQKFLFVFASTNSCMNPFVYGYFNFCSGNASNSFVGRQPVQLQNTQFMTVSMGNSRRGSNGSSIFRSSSIQSMTWRSSRFERKESQESMRPPLNHNHLCRSGTIRHNSVGTPPTRFITLPTGPRPAVFRNNSADSMPKPSLQKVGLHGAAVHSKNGIHSVPVAVTDAAEDSTDKNKPESLLITDFHLVRNMESTHIQGNGIASALRSPGGINQSECQISRPSVLQATESENIATNSTQISSQSSTQDNISR